jgi:glycosyltransferase involved in cell wall biosynthesis
MKESRPRVSVIVPNYMHAPYLEERLQSIANQSFQDFEVLLLDDASTDRSVEILQAWEAKDARFRFTPNAANSGSTFAQWNKGATMAQGDYLWIAESDDVADPQLLEKLVALLDAHPSAVIAYGQSMLINEQSEPLHSFDVHYQYIFGGDRWSKPYANSGMNEIEQYMILHNVVPNASGALLRAERFHAIGGADPTAKLNGDWMFYIRMLEAGDIVYTPEILNYFRLHAVTQRQRANANGKVYRELLAIVDYIRGAHHPERWIVRKAYRNVAAWWTHSLYRQTWRGPGLQENIAVNWALFKRFLTLHPLVLLHIPYEGLVRLAVVALEGLGVKEPLRRVLHRFFPRHFMPRAT